MTTSRYSATDVGQPTITFGIALGPGFISPWAEERLQGSEPVLGRMQSLRTASGWRLHPSVPNRSQSNTEGVDGTLVLATLLSMTCSLLQ